MRGGCSRAGALGGRASPQVRLHLFLVVGGQLARAAVREIHARKAQARAVAAGGLVLGAALLADFAGYAAGFAVGSALFGYHECWRRWRRSRRGRGRGYGDEACYPEGGPDWVTRPSGYPEVPQFAPPGAPRHKMRSAGLLACGPGHRRLAACSCRPAAPPSERRRSDWPTTGDPLLWRYAISHAFHAPPTHTRHRYILRLDVRAVECGRLAIPTTHARNLSPRPPPKHTHRKASTLVNRAVASAYPNTRTRSITR